MADNNYTVESVKYGKRHDPIKLLKIMSPDDWEVFIEEWLDFLRNENETVDRLGGAGDQGRDVIVTFGDGSWHNYQCKHYDHALYPGDIWLEIGKLVYYTYIGEYSVPAMYYFVAPQGVGTSVLNFLRNPEKLKNDLKEIWDKKCASNISKKNVINLDEELLKHIDSIDFKIFHYVKPADIIEQHRNTRHYATRFGGALPDRSVPDLPPEAVANREIQYTKKLIDAYADHKDEEYICISDISDADLHEHYKDSRIQFYCAEHLKRYARESLPEGEFEKLQNQIHSGIKDDLRLSHADGYIKVCTVTKSARELQITDSTLLPVLKTDDRSGICHQLANDKDDIKWVKK